MWAGGVMDARFGPTTYETGHYEGLGFQPPIIINGKIYYNIRSIPREGYRVLDLYTGEELWFRNSTGPVSGTGGGFDAHGYLPYGLLSMGQIYDYSSPNQHGGFPYIWSTSGPDGTWMMYDAETGNYICSIENVPSWASGRRTFGVYGKEGSLLYYNLDTRNGLLQCWNTSRAIWYEEEFYSNTYWMWRPTLNETFDGNNGYSLNVSIPEVEGSLLCVREGEFAIGGTGGQNDDDAVVQGTLWALSLEPGKEGTQLWEISFTPPRASATAELSYRGRYPVSGPTVDPEDGVFLFEESVTLKRWGYSLETGEMLWGPTDPEPAMNYYGMYDSIYQGKLFSYGYGGVLIAYNITTGEELWRYEANNVGFESPYGNYPIHVTCIADGKIYLVSGEHSLTQPMWRGPNLRCINADNGDELWKISYMGAGDGGAHLTATTTVIADGYIVGLNYYDNQIYCFGKGPSKTTVTVQDDVVPLGDSVLIKGTVTDQSPGAMDTPAIADEDQEDWMEYVYMQQEIPMNAKGVEVTLDAIDPNGNYISIGRTTSDMSGLYSYIWTPENEGKYTIIATFEGSKSYYSSYAETAIGITEPASAAQPIEPEPTEPAEAPFITTELAVIIAVVVVAVIAVAAYWMLRKRK
jgi:outer membrane protein assembly factor BamB